MKTIAKLAGVMGLVTTLSAHAGFIIDTTNVGPVPGQASATPANNDLAPILNAHGLSVSSYFVGGRLESDTAGTVSYEYLGKEAGYTNTFAIYSGADQIFSTAGHANSKWDPSALSVPSNVNAGSFVDFTFCTDGGGDKSAAGCLSNANNSFFSALNVPAGKSIAVSLLDPFTALLWWDDSGAGPDADHDDMVVLAKLTTKVPEPGTSALFGAALLGMGLAMRKRGKGTNGPSNLNGFNYSMG